MKHLVHGHNRRPIFWCATQIVREIVIRTCTFIHASLWRWTRSRVVQLWLNLREEACFCTLLGGSDCQTSLRDMLCHIYMTYTYVICHIQTYVPYPCTLSYDVYRVTYDIPYVYTCVMCFVLCFVLNHTSPLCIRDCAERFNIWYSFHYNIAALEIRLYIYLKCVAHCWRLNVCVKKHVILISVLIFFL